MSAINHLSIPAKLIKGGTMDYKDIILDIADAAAALTFNRPGKLNSMTSGMHEEIRHALAAIGKAGVRAMLLTGAGRGFCGGLDIQDTASGKGIGSGDLGANLDLREAPPTVLHGLDTPTICALNGGAAGYGMDLALGCDIRIAGESGKLAAAFTRRGVLPESGGTWLLPRLVGWAKAAEIVFRSNAAGRIDLAPCGLL